MEMSPKWEKFIQSGFRMPFYMNLYVEGSAKAIRNVTGWTHPKSLVVIENQMNTVYESPETMKTYAEYILPKLKDEKFRDKFVKAFETTDTALLKHCRQLYFRDYSKTNLNGRGRGLSVFASLFTNKFGIYGLPKLTDMAINAYLPKLFSVKLQEKDLAALSKPTVHSEYGLERISFLKILREIKERKLAKLFMGTSSEILDHLGRHDPILYYKIESHMRTFVWINISHHVQPLTLDQMVANLKIGLGDENAEQELNERESEIKMTVKRQGELLSHLKLNIQDRDILSFIRNLNEINENRKAAMSKAILWSYPLFQSIADSLEIDVISLRQLTIHELRKAIKRGSISASDQKLIRERLEYYVCLLDKGKIINKSGAEARSLINRELGRTDYSSIRELKGSVAQPGKVSGKVRLVLLEHQVSRLLPGEILVTSMTDPNMISAMKKAAAIVTDEGGITCHAAIISRELKTPCIIGTKIATKVFKNGDLVEVDAEKGSVTKIS